MIRFALIASAATLAVSALSAAGAQSAGQGDFMARHYPPTALKNGEEGRVAFRVAISKDGHIERCEITESSGYSTLDRETCDFIAIFANMQPARDAKGNAFATIQTGVVNWHLPAGVAKSAAPRMASAGLPPPLVCKRSTNSGSMLAHTTACMTDAEWGLQDRLVRQTLDERIGRRPCTVEGC
jgi:TonB family protein